MTPRNRQAILTQNGLHQAPPALQEAFWRRYNQPRRREVAELGQLAADWLAEGRDGADRLEAVVAAWREVVPATILGRTRVEGLGRGRLRVMVDSAATRFTLTRRMGHTLIDAINAKMGKTAVRWIDCRVTNLMSEQG